MLLFKRIEHLAWVLYKRILNSLKEYLNGLKNAARSLTDDDLLDFYTAQWSRYLISANYLDAGSRRVNRDWVRREQDECRKGIYDIYTLCFVRWKEDFSADIEERLLRAATDRERKGETVDRSQIDAINERLRKANVL